jgi:protein tyrosine/serine phosphatase
MERDDCTTVEQPGAERHRRIGSMMTTPNVPSRLLPLVGAFNFRDLGGYPTTDGRRTRWGRVFRSDTLNALSAEDLQVLRQLGLRTVVDLRTTNEAERDGRGMLVSEPIEYVHLSVLPEEGGDSVGAPDTDGSTIGARYLWYLQAGEAALSAALRIVANGSGHPVVFHCTAGKDRTGVLSALILGCLGVDRVTIVDDYMQTAAVLHLIIDRLRNHPVYGEVLQTASPARFGVEAATMHEFLDGLDQRYGGAAGWATAVGIEPRVLDQLRAALLEDPDDERQ